MHPDVAALLELQTDDAEIYSLERGLGDLAPRLEALAKARDRELAAAAHARRELDLEERRYRELQSRIAQHRQLHERHQAQLDTVSNARQATAAMAQLDQARRMIADVERELDAMSRRVGEMRRAVEDRERAVQELEREQEAARATLASDRAALEARLREARGRRDDRAQRVPRALLGRYERIRTRKREHTLVPLRGVSCSHCDTMIPMQRRTAMMGTGAVEICEGCGVLLYAPE
ncbi:MAG: zinc ribbon domain-containing protein [Gemmatimonadaceae bacterium]